MNPLISSFKKMTKENFNDESYDVKVKDFLMISRVSDLFSIHQQPSLTKITSSITITTIDCEITTTITKINNKRDSHWRITRRWKRNERIIYFRILQLAIYLLITH